MIPRERVFAALEHREPDRIPWGEHSIDYNVYEDIFAQNPLLFLCSNVFLISGFKTLFFKNSLKLGHIILLMLRQGYFDG